MRNNVYRKSFPLYNKRMRSTISVISLFAVTACATAPPSSTRADAPLPTRADTSSFTRVAARAITRIAFGSCNREDLPQPLWPEIAAQDPQLFIWLGDNIYGDTYDMAVMRAKYEQQLRNPHYRQFIRAVPVIGTWDDHDYGLNDGGREYTARAASQQVTLDFLGEPEGTARRRQEGIYASYTYGPADRQIKVILLDTRYHRDPIGSNGTVLGDAQWQWLESELRNSTARVHVVASSIQVIAEDHRFEKWANFPTERERLFRLIGESGARNVVFLSGDRHIAELSRLDHPAVDYPLYDLTSSGLTHTWSTAHPELNRYRDGDLVIALNYGLLDVDWAAWRLRLQVLDASGAVRIDREVPLL